jgi:hypothetical protein
MFELTCLCNGFNRSANGKDALVHARDNLTDASSDASLLTKISDIFPAFAYDDASFLCVDKSTKSQGVMSIIWRR